MQARLEEQGCRYGGFKVRGGSDKLSIQDSPIHQLTHIQCSEVCSSLVLVMEDVPGQARGNGLNLFALWSK